MSPVGWTSLRTALRAVPPLRKWHARLTGGGVILLYHRVANLANDPYALCVSPERFEEHLQVIRRYTDPIPLSDMAKAVRGGRIPERAVSITFDDGYPDNLHQAVPLLERYDVPATMFVTTGRIGRDREFWWDELERLLLSPAALPEVLEIDLFGERVALDLGPGGSGTEPAEGGRDWDLGADFDPTPRHAAFRRIYELLLPRTPGGQADALDRLASWSGVVPRIRESHRALECDGVLQMAQSGLIDIGSHTVDHPALHSQPTGVQREEVTASRATLEEWLGHPVESFSYPYALHSDVSVEEVKRAGYTSAVAGFGQPVGRRSDLWKLPRVDAPDADGDALAERLTEIFGRRVGPTGRAGLC